MSQPSPQTSRAVLIGTAQYEHMESLPAVRTNLHTLRQELMRHEVWGLSPQHCVVVEDPASPQEMIEPVHQAGQDAVDVLLVYYAGHGTLGPNNSLYLGMPKTVNDPTQTHFSAVAYDSLRIAIKNSRAQCRVVILDCCYSGSAVNAMAPSNMPLTDIEGTYVITSAPPLQSAMAPENAEFTAFTHELIQVLRQGIPEAGKLLTLERVFDHIKAELTAKALPLPWQQQRNDVRQLELFKNRALTSPHPPPGYGNIPGITEGQYFPNRWELHRAEVHRPLQAGICGTHGTGGAESIVVSGGYHDDRDFGDVILYTGHGGQENKRQVRDQDPSDSGNAALFASIATRYPVRVVRGAGGDPFHSPPDGYSYDGLYTVEDYWIADGIDGFRVLQFRLEKIRESTAATVPTESSIDHLGIDLHRWEPIALGVYGDRLVSDRVKEAHDYECQICGLTLRTPAGHPLAQTIHLKGLALPHRGPDVAGNIVCVCPNHRLQLQFGTITVDDDLKVVDESSGEPFEELRVNRRHKVDRAYLRYHRRLYRR